MNIASAKPGDIVLVDKKGRRFHAEVRERVEGGLRIAPLDSRISYYNATSREVKGLWHKSRQRQRSSTQAQEVNA